MFWLDSGNLDALNVEGERINTVTVDTSTSSDCSDYNVSISAKAMFVLDNDAFKFYELDVDDGTVIYHVHESIDTGVSDISGSVVLFHNEAGGGHEH